MSEDPRWDSQIADSQTTHPLESLPRRGNEHLQLHQATRQAELVASMRNVLPRYHLYLTTPKGVFPSCHHHHPQLVLPSRNFLLSQSSLLRLDGTNQPMMTRFHAAQNDYSNANIGSGPSSHSDQDFQQSSNYPIRPIRKCMRAPYLLPFHNPRQPHQQDISLPDH